MPLILNVSTWDLELDVAKWAAIELHRRYRCPQPLAEALVEQQRLTLLFDGIDEHPRAEAAAQKLVERFEGSAGAGWQFVFTFRTGQPPHHDPDDPEPSGETVSRVFTESSLDIPRLVTTPSRVEDMLTVLASHPEFDELVDQMHRLQRSAKDWPSWEQTLARPLIFATLARAHLAAGTAIRDAGDAQDAVEWLFGSKEANARPASWQ